MFNARSLSRSVALSGAAIDAFIVGKKNQRKYRFWMEFLSLNMGDFMIFNHIRHKWVSVQLETGWALDTAQFVLLLPTILCQELIYGLMLFSFVLHFNYHACEAASHMSWVAGSFGGLIVIGSFFGFLPHFDLLLNSVVLRGIHQLLQFYHQATHPPTAVHVTDGGLLDNTGVMQLFRRRIQRILLAYGGNDPKEQFKYIQKLVVALATEHIGSLHDPIDPRRDLNETFHKFRSDKQATYLHLKVKYGWCDDGCDQPSSDLFIVMCRLTPAARDMKVKPLMTESTILGEESDDELSDDGESAILQRKLGGCCCDCCHVIGCNCGRKFPNPLTMNQFLTPQLFNSLCRLGHDISGPAIEAIATPL